MVEMVVNAAQLVVGGVCLAYCAVKALQTKSRGWIVLLLFYAEIFIGNLYWQLYLAFFNSNPKFSFVSGFCWDVAFGFLLLLVTMYSKGRISIKKDPVLAVIPVTAFGLAILYMKYGNIIDNLVVAVLMTVLLLRCVHGLKTIRGEGIYAGFEANPAAKKLYLVTLFFSAAEYLSWTASCFFWDNKITNPYYWFDTFLTVTLIFFIPALKACDTPEYSLLSGEKSL